MAISAQDLRIGNWVQNDAGYKWQIEDGWQLDEATDKEMYQPIPLTPEILLKCGFVNVRDVHWRVPNSDASKSFEICVWSDHVSYTMANNFHLVIQSLHQLQNLYHSLTGQELKINL